MAIPTLPHQEDFAASIRRRVLEGLQEYVDSVVKEMIQEAQQKIEREARDYAARVVLTLSHMAEIREMRDRIVIELRLPER